MPLLQIKIEGFRSLRKVDWKPGKLNVVIGPNGSGKSNLLRMLEMMSASAEGQLEEWIQDAGGMEPLVWDGSANSLYCELKVELGPEQHGDYLSYVLDLLRLGGGSSYKIGIEQLSDLARNSELLVKGQDKSIVMDLNHQPVPLYNQESISDVESILFQFYSPIQSFSSTRFKRVLERWTIYQYFQVHKDAKVRQAVITRLEQRVAPDGQNLISVLHTLYTSDRTFKQRINEAMTAAFGSDFDELVFPPAADQRIQMRVRWRTLKREQSTADLSDGTLRFLYLLTILASPDPPPLIAIDEPETGLHPSMLPIIAEFAAAAAERTQVILTTHSDQLLDAFSEFEPTTTVAKWSNGETQLVTLDPEELRRWLQEYSLGSLYRSGELEGEALLP